MVAKGKFGGMLFSTSKIWDNVGPQVVIEEAGGLYTDFWGQKLDYTNPVGSAQENFTCCTAPHLLHAKLQAIIRGAR